MIDLRRLIKSFKYAVRGTRKVIREEQNLKIQLVVGLLVFILGAVLKIDRIEWMFLVLSVGLVILLETVNSAIERVTDVLKPRIHGYVKEIKDIMSAAVFIASLLAVTMGLFIFLPHL